MLYLIQGDHWSAHGRRFAVCYTPEAANAQALAWTNELIADIHPCGAYVIDEAEFDGKIVIPDLVEEGGDWKAGLHALAKAILAERQGSQESLDKLLAENDLEQLIANPEEELPCVWIIDVEETDEHPIIGAIKAQRDAWVQRQAPDGQEMNDSHEQEEADTVISVLDDLLMGPGAPPVTSSPEIEPVPTNLEAAARQVIDAFGGDVPDWIMADIGVLENALANPEPIQVVVNMTGGVLQGVTAGAPVDLVVVDYEFEGYTAAREEDRVYLVPQSDEVGAAAEVLRDRAEVDRPWTGRVFAAIAAQDAKGTNRG